MKRVVAFGEIMLRLSPPGYLKFIQTDQLCANYTGAEANVCVSLCSLGDAAEFVTRVPDSDISRAALSWLRKYGVMLDHVAYGGERLGVYYLERGASQRPSKVTYDRKYSSISAASGDAFDWENILAGAGWFHFTGITAALSPAMPGILRRACLAARGMGIPVSCDLNYRKNLWTGEQAAAVMRELVTLCDVVVGNEEDAEKCLGIVPDGSDVVSGKLDIRGYEKAAARICGEFGVKTVAFTLRTSRSASDNTWAGMLSDGKRAYLSRSYDIHLVDRVGGGDSFSAGLIHALMHGRDPQYAIEFAAALSCLKQTMEYDFSLSSVEDVERLMAGDGSGRVQR
ncbi:MAG TPA: sugar kinase [Candidatus Limnocylindria bacterium]|nr:sugar kinase [Candidatus Limnocylindria bacterium]